MIDIVVRQDSRPELLAFVHAASSMFEVATQENNAVLTKGVYKQPVHGCVECQGDCTGDHLRPDHLLRLQVVGGCDVGGEPPHPWQSPPESKLPSYADTPGNKHFFPRQGIMHISVMYETFEEMQEQIHQLQQDITMQCNRS